MIDIKWVGTLCSKRRFHVCQSDANNIIFYQDMELYFNHLTLRNYTESVRMCEERGAELVTIKDSQMNEVIVRELDTGRASPPDPQNQRYFIGLNDIKNEQKWVWSDGTTATYTNWYRGGWTEPTNPTNREEDCVITLENKYARKWADVSCSTKYPSICQKKLVFNVRGNCKYHISHLDKRTYYDAQSYCFRMNNTATLAMIKTEEIHEYIEEAIKTRFGSVNNMTFWVGAKKDNSDFWRYIDGEPFSTGGFEKWANSQPESGNKLYLNTSVEESNTDLLWFSGTNDDKKGFICELPVIDPCHSTPCKNGGSCRSTIGCQVECSCDNGYSGTYCDRGKKSV
uniref:secretory phospholipase A2 receptor-like n=1 Tax=Styela clava TaxID=7725 RepID=UPI00193A258F|nr:secretory phospholipase A2 receptor-like [Styela clava]